MTPTNQQPAESVATNHFLNTGYRPNDDYKSFVNGFIAGSNWKENQLREENQRLKEQIKAMQSVNEHP